MNKEKKQIVVLVSLMAVVGAVGAFQFMNKGPSPEIVAKVEEKPAVVDVPEGQPVTNVMDALFLNTLEDRDPFVPQAILIKDPTLVRPPRPDPEIRGGGDREPVNPFRLNGDSGELTPGLPLGAVALRGVILGPKPLAVFEQPDGRQTLVAVGGKLGNGAVVVAIGDGKVTLKQNGKIRTMEFEEAYS